MKNPCLIAGIAFGVGSLTQIIAGHHFAAWATGLFAAGLLLSDVTYLPAAPAPVKVGARRTWRNLAAVLLLGASIGLFGYDIGGALYQATHHTAAVTQAK